MQTSQIPQQLRRITGSFLIVVKICFGCGVTFAQDDRAVAIVEILSNRIELEGPTPEYLKIRGWAYYELAKFKEAMYDYEQALMLDSMDNELYFRLAEIQYDSGLYQRSVANYSHAIDLAPDSLSYRISRAVASEKIGLYSDARSDYNYVLEKSPNNVLARINRANLYFEIFKDYQSSLNDWNALIGCNPDSRYYNDRALVYTAMGLFNKAIMDLTAAIMIDDRNSKFYFNRGYAYGMTDKTQEAFIDFDRALTLDSLNPFLYKLRGEIFLKMGEEENACKDFHRAQNLNLDVKEYLRHCSH